VAIKKGKNKDFADFDFGDIGSNYDPNLDTGIPGGYDVNLDPNPSGAYDPRLDPNLPPGQYDPRLDPGVPAPGNSYGGGGSVPMAPSGGGGSNGGIASQLARMLGLGGGANDQSGGMAGILGLLASLYGAHTQSQATAEATRIAQEGLANASAQASSTIGGAQANFNPFINAGAKAAGNISSMPLSALAGDYKPIGSGKGLNLRQIVGG
jgi:hypothetical protein